tara:strand:- start:5363 stop:6559 length:1197 start_codon:yes stop_codon:yes gene_type:complete
MTIIDKINNKYIYIKGSGKYITHINDENVSLSNNKDITTEWLVIQDGDSMYLKNNSTNNYLLNTNNTIGVINILTEATKWSVINETQVSNNEYSVNLVNNTDPQNLKYLYIDEDNNYNLKTDLSSKTTFNIIIKNNYNYKNLCIISSVIIFTFLSYVIVWKEIIKKGSTQFFILIFFYIVCVISINIYAAVILISKSTLEQYKNEANSIISYILNQEDHIKVLYHSILYSLIPIGLVYIISLGKFIKSIIYDKSKKFKEEFNKIWEDLNINIEKSLNVNTRTQFNFFGNEKMGTLFIPFVGCVFLCIGSLIGILIMYNSKLDTECWILIGFIVPIFILVCISLGKLISNIFTSSNKSNDSNIKKYIIEILLVVVVVVVVVGLLVFYGGGLMGILNENR